jgi:hypothetical protein
MIPEFKEFDKIPRLNREVVITEKIDGTNACVVVTEVDIVEKSWLGGVKVVGKERKVFAQSRNRLLTPENDNAGFARWVEENAAELQNLGPGPDGPGYHYGEWWGLGIGRKYGMTEKVFSLFNVYRWQIAGKETPPACCRVVPLLHQGVLKDVDYVLEMLKTKGSFAAPGFMDPEGAIIWHDTAKHYFKVTIKGDESRKGAGK